jgi:hypothetical protein
MIGDGELSMIARPANRQYSSITDRQYSSITNRQSEINLQSAI